MLEERIQQFRARIQEPGSDVREDTREMALELLTVISEIDEFVGSGAAGTLGISEDSVQNHQLNLRSAIDHLRNSVHPTMEREDER